MTTNIPQPAVAALTTGAREQFLRGLLSSPAANLTSEQTMARLGEAIPVVWGRREADEFEGDVGGVWVAPLATEARFENDDSNNLTARYQLVLSQGQVAAVQPGEFWQGAQQRGALVQAYGGRAGDWAPGNALQQRYRVETVSYQFTVTGQPWTGWKAHRSRPYTLDEFNQQIRASITITARGNYVTSMVVEPVKQDAYGLMVGPNAINQAVQNAILYNIIAVSGSSRYLPSWQYQREPSPTESRPTVTLSEEGLSYSAPFAGGSLLYQPAATYVIKVTETNHIPIQLPTVANYCGTGEGNYYDLSTVAFSCTFPADSSDWRQQVWVFLRGGAQASRLIESGAGPSPWLPDLARYLALATERVTADQLDTDSLTLAARFCRAMGLRFNGEIRTPANLWDYLGRIAPLFLLELQDRGGRLGLVPAHPVNAAYRLSTDPLTPVLQLNESHIVAGTFNPQWIGAAERQPTALIVSYRAQPANQPAYDRVLEVRPEGSAEAGPFETLDLREFCCTTRHALIVGLWRQARRNLVTHRLMGLRILPEFDSDVLRLVAGSVVQVSYPRVPDLGEASVHAYLYRVLEVRTDATGQTTLDLEHLPVDHDRRSLLALSVLGQLPTVQSLPKRAVARAYAPIVGGGALLQPAEPVRAVAVAGEAFVGGGALVPAVRRVAVVAGQIEDIVNNSIIDLKFSGTNNSTAFVDSGINQLTVTVTGGPVISNDISYQGGTVGKFVGDGYLSATVSGGFNSGDDWTMIMQVYKTANSGMLFNSRTTGFNADGIDIFHDFKVGTAGQFLFNGISLSLNAWHELRIVQRGTSLKRFIDGTENGSVNIANGWTGGNFRIGGSPYGNVGYFTGYLGRFTVKPVAEDP